MSPPNAAAQTSTPSRLAGRVYTLPLVQDEEDVVLGCECANPVLQIEAWATEDAAAAAQKFN
jgi:hypothetical protein